MWVQPLSPALKKPKEPRRVQFDTEGTSQMLRARGNARRVRASKAGLVRVTHGVKFSCGLLSASRRAVLSQPRRKLRFLL
jgi:hypothetical protein